MANHAAAVAAFNMPSEQNGATGDNRPPHLFLDGGQNMRCKISRAVISAGPTLRDIGRDQRGTVSSNSSGEGVPVSLGRAR